jgi:hypothetical protein
MSLTPTVLVLIGALAAAGLANWRERRPRDPGQVPLISYAAIQMVALVVALLMAAHLVSLLTGHPLVGRLMP